MKRLMQLRQRKADLVEEADLLAGKEADGSITEAEATRLDAITGTGGEFDKINASIAREERVADERRSMEAAAPGVNDDVEDERTARTPAEPRKEKPKFNSLGEQLMAVAAAAQGGARDIRLNWQSLQAATGMNEGSGPDGGFLVQQDFADELLMKAHQQSELARRVRTMPLSEGSNSMVVNAVKETSRVNGSRFGGIQAFWTGEGQLKQASQMQFRAMSLKLHKLTGLLYATDELLQDAPALESWIDQAFSEEFAFKMDAAIYEGSGAGMPLGFTLSPALITVPKASGQAADTIVIENIVAMWGRLNPASQSRVVWLVNPQLQAHLTLLKIGDTPVYVPGGSVAGAPYATLFGRPVIATEFASELGDKGDITLFDPLEYLWIRRGTIERATSMHVRFVHDETAFRFVARADGQPMWEAPMTPYKGTTTTSPYVTLAERA